MPSAPASPTIPRNRFIRYRKTTLTLVVVAILFTIELASYAVIAIKGHGDLRFQYRYNRILSGYTVFQNVPNFSFRSSAIKSDPAEPAPVLDEHGFLSDGPVSREKLPGTFRIFLLGGSTAFGAGQNVRYHSVHPYPDGLYSYPASIAGRLEAFLQSHDERRHYEVINAAGFERRIHQSMLQYLETICRFGPDLIISLEGMNDVYSIASGTPFEDVEQQLPFYVDMYRRRSSPLNYSATYYVLSTAYEKWVNRRTPPSPPPADPAATAPAATAAVHSVAAGATIAAGRAEYEKKRKQYGEHAARLLQIVRQYFSVTATDGTPCLFALQPLLHRVATNKRLSPTEQKLAAVMAPASADSNTMPRVDEQALILMYFYDDFLSPAIREIAAKFGVTYLDLNAEISGLGPDVEFYTDYCHLTPAGNQHVAEILGRAVLSDNAKRNEPRTK